MSELQSDKSYIILRPQENLGKDIVIVLRFADRVRDLSYTDYGDIWREETKDGKTIFTGPFDGTGIVADFVAKVKGSELAQYPRGRVGNYDVIENYQYTPSQAMACGLYNVERTKLTFGEYWCGPDDNFPERTWVKIAEFENGPRTVTVRAEAFPALTYEIVFEEFDSFNPGNSPVTMKTATNSDQVRLLAEQFIDGTMSFKR